MSGSAVVQVAERAVPRTNYPISPLSLTGSNLELAHHSGVLMFHPQQLYPAQHPGPL